MARRHVARRLADGVAVIGAALLTLTGCAEAGNPTAADPGSSRAGHSVAPVVRPVAALPGTTSSWDGRTLQQQFAPYDGAGHLSVQAADGGAGSCFATSIAVPLAGVYRCLAGNSLLDPCFAPSQETTPPTVACFLSPWSGALVVTISGPLPPFGPALMTGNPWGVELANGARCVAVTGVVPTYRDVNLVYRCDGKDMAGIDADSGGDLTAHYGPVDGPLVDVGVVTAWRGRSYRISG